MALFGAGFEFFGAMYGQGMIGTGMIFGAAGADTASLGALLGIVAACTSLIAAVLPIFVRHVRPLAATLLAADIIGTPRSWRASSVSGRC